MNMNDSSQVADRVVGSTRNRPGIRTVYPDTFKRKNRLADGPED